MGDMTVSQHWDDTDIYSINLIYLDKMDDFTKFDLIFWKIFIFGKKHQFWLKFEIFKLDLYLSTASTDKKFANEYVHI